MIRRETIMWAVLLSLISAVALVALGNLRIAAPAAVSVMVVWGAAVCILPRPTAGIRHLVMAALLVRVVLMAAEPSLSDDVYRYLWEGHVAIQVYPPLFYGGD